MCTQRVLGKTDSWHFYITKILLLCFSMIIMGISTTSLETSSWKWL